NPGDNMMAVLRGRVVISNPSPDGRPLVLTIFRDGDVFGEMALLDGKESSADATAAAECQLLVVPRRSLLRLLGLPEQRALLYCPPPCSKKGTSARTGNMNQPQSDHV